MAPKHDELPEGIRMAERIFGRDRVVNWLYRAVLAAVVLRIWTTTANTWEMIQKIPAIIQTQEEQKKIIDEHSKTLKEIMEVLHKHNIVGNDLNQKELSTAIYERD
jgi:hypothetical protein